MPKRSQPLVRYDGEWCLSLNPMQGNWSPCHVDLGYIELFHIPVLTSFSFTLVRDFWGTLCSSIKQIKAPFLFDWEQGIALYAMKGNRASSLSEGEVSWFFSNCGGKLGYILELRQG